MDKGALKPTETANVNQRPKGPELWRFLPEIILGFIVNILAAIAYDQFKHLISPATLIGGLVLAVTLFQVFLVRHASRKADQFATLYLETVEAAIEHKYRNEIQLLTNRRDELQKQLAGAIEQAGKAVLDLDEVVRKQPFIQATLRRHRSEILHNLIHRARDFGVKLLPSRSQRIPGPESLTLHAKEIGDLLQLIASLFCELAPKGTKVWVALRVRRADHNFYTALRTPECHPNREVRSEPLEKGHTIITRLEKTYSNQENADCVLLTGAGRPEWQPLTNDYFKENKSVLLGAVFSKYWNGKYFTNPLLTWVLCVNADCEGAFDDSHKPLMRCCNDILSWLLNEVVRFPIGNSPENGKSKRS